MGRGWPSLATQAIGERGSPAGRLAVDVRETPVTSEECRPGCSTRLRRLKLASLPVPTAHGIQHHDD